MDEEISTTNRLFLRNLSYQTTEVELSGLFAPYGVKQLDCHVPLDDSSKHSKGIAFVTFSNPEVANEARKALDKCDFQGRILQILPANEQPEEHQKSHEYDTNTSFKLRKEKKRKRDNAKDTNDATKSWNASYLPSDTVLQSTSDKLQMQKSDVLELDKNTSGTVAVRMAMAETQIIQENIKFFETHGIDISSSTKKRTQ